VEFEVEGEIGETRRRQEKCREIRTLIERRDEMRRSRYAAR